MPGRIQTETLWGDWTPVAGPVIFTRAVNEGLYIPDKIVHISPYSSTFSVPEEPISENGKWVNNGVNWTYVAVNSGFAHGTQTSGPGTFDDSYAHLQGFPPNMLLQAMIYRAAVVTGQEECELLLRWNDSAGVAQGYEVDFACWGGKWIVKWNGAVGSFTTLVNLSDSIALNSGDLVGATIIGPLMTMYVNSTVIGTWSDATYTTGEPGMGFYVETGAENDVYGFTSFAAIPL